MANPQTENGYTKVANELLEAVLMADLGKREQKVVWAVIRQTYGYNRKEDAVSIFQIAQLTGMDRRNAARTLNGLIEAKVINATSSGRKSHGVEISSLSVNKDYSAWETGVKTTPVVDKETGGETTPVEDEQTGVKTTPGSKQHRGQNDPRNRGQIDPKTGVKTTPSKDRKTGKKEGAQSRPGSKDQVAKKIAERELPDWLPRDAWEAFVWYRRERRKDLTEYAAHLAVKHLGEFREKGHDPRVVMEQTIANGWTGLFETKSQHGEQNQNKREVSLDDASPI